MSVLAFVLFAFLLAPSQLFTQCPAPNGGGAFTFTADLSWMGASTTGDFEYSVDGGPYQPANRTDFSTDGGETVSISGLITSSTSLIEIRFEDQQDCFIQSQFVPPPIDPAGYIYCVETGEIVTGGTVVVNPPPGEMIQFLTDGGGTLLDGTNGRYAWIVVGAPVVEGIYTQTYTGPNGEPLVTNPTPFGDGDQILDPTPGMGDNLGGDDPLLIGSDVNGAGDVLLDFSLAANPYFLTFDLAIGDALVDLNNLPVSYCPTGNCFGVQVQINNN